MSTTPSSKPVEIRVTTDGWLPASTADYARKRIGTLLHLAHRPVLNVRVRVTRHADPAAARPAVAQVNLDVDGRLVRAQTDGETAWEAIDLVAARLRHRLERIARHWEARRGGMPSHEPHEWRHNSEPTRRRRRSTRGRSASGRSCGTSRTPRAGCSVDEAADDMDLLDYDFHLFTEAGTDRDSVLYRAGGTGYRLAQLTPPNGRRLADFDLPITVSTRPAPVLTLHEAVARLELGGWPFLFFSDAGRPWRRALPPLRRSLRRGHHSRRRTMTRPCGNVAPRPLPVSVLGRDRGE